MSELKIEVMIGEEKYTRDQLEYIQFEREKHVLQEMIHLGAKVKKDGQILTFDDVNYLHQEETTDILYNAKMELGAEGIKALYKDSLEKSNQMWRELEKVYDADAPYQEAVTYMSVKGMSFMEFAESMKQSLSNGEASGVEAIPEHFPAEEISGLMRNEKNSVETMGMYGGPVDAIVSVDPTKTGGVKEEDGFKNMMSGTSRLLDGTQRHDIAVHQFKMTDDGFELKMIVLFPAAVPKEMVKGHCIHLAIESMGTVKKAFEEKTRVAQARFLDKEEDLKKLGMTPGIVEVHEDGRQSVLGKPGSEVWYFDAVMEDGTKFVGGFRTKPATASEAPEDLPLMVITVTTPDGTVYSDTATYKPEESRIATDKCDFHCGPHSVVGDLKDYNIIIEPISHEGQEAKTIDGLECTATKGVGVDLHFSAEVKPFRHGAGRTVFDQDDSQFSSWLCIPRMSVSGTIVINGEEKQVKGMGYHDHRCMAINDMKAWHHWLWGRQTFEDYTVVIYDLVTSEKYGFLEVPLFAIYDKEGNIIFDNDGTMTRNITEMSMEEKSRKEYPKSIQYHMEKDGKVIDYSLNWKEILEVREMYWSAPKEQRAIFDQMGIQISYNRYFSNGELQITENGETQKRNGTMIYEFAYVGKPDERAHLNITKS